MIARYCVRAKKCSYGKINSPCDLHENCPAFKCDITKAVDTFNKSKEKESKYRNKIVKTDEGTFKSEWEYKRWCELKILQRCGLIKDLKKQVKFVLVEKTSENRETAYFADFTYVENGEFVVEDTKSKPTKTDLYRLKKKLMFERYGIKIKEVEQ